MSQEKYIGMDVHQATIGFSWLVRNSSASLRASIRSLLLPSISAVHSDDGRSGSGDARFEGSISQ